ncbi:MAG TPA: neutral/alkaline non-lysosomal ceramidase N-terminal domain-containing protein [Candidatus Binatus sp.]|uniref:neutral/alkaline non-lysosomal ceramidase N-terminal domain-containing protein n=1 Tax=Candidatus Binatus sp. TaxID=2811406 RepID=UPI002F40D043
MSPLYAGAARVKLDPPAGLAMLGYGNRVGRNAGVHDDLAAQALVLRGGADGAGNAKVAIVGVDVLALGARIADDIRARVAAGTDIPADSILVCATHTHSAPAFNIFATPLADAKPAEGRNLEWERALPAKIADAIVQANKNLEPATLRAATAPFTLGINRRLMRPQRQIQIAANRSGPADATAQVLGAYRADGTPIAFLMNYPCHGVVLCEDNLLYSRDWPGFAMDEIEGASGSAGGPRPISIFLQGATGNIDPRSRGNFEVAEQHGRAMGRGALDALEHAPSIANSAIAARRIVLNLKLKDFSDDLALARDCAAQTQASLDNHRGGDGYQLKRLRDHHAQSRAALVALEALEEQNRRDRRVDLAHCELATAITVVTVGDLAIVGIPGELFVELGLALKANPYFTKTLVAGYCNDLIGYIPTRAAYPEGGYEVDTARVAAGSGEAMVGTALSALAAIRA